MIGQNRFQNLRTTSPIILNQSRPSSITPESFCNEFSYSSSHAMGLLEALEEIPCSFLLDFRPLGSRGAWNLELWLDMVPKLPSMVQGRVPGGVYRPWLRPHQVGAHGHAWGTHSGPNLSQMGPYGDPKFCKKINFFVAYIEFPAVTCVWSNFDPRGAGLPHGSSWANRPGPWGQAFA